MNTRDGYVNDALLTDLLEAASGRMEELTGRWFLPDPAITDADGNVLVPTPGPVQREADALNSEWCMAYDCREATVVLADGRDVTATTKLVRIRPEHPAHALWLPCSARAVHITGWFGFAEVPASVREATLGWAQRAYHEHRARMSDAQADPDGGGFVSYFRQVPPFVATTIDYFRVAGV